MKNSDSRAMYTVAVKSPSNLTFDSRIRITGSKSESNRLLLLKALNPGLEIQNLSNAEDTQVMRAGLECREGTVDIHHAGTAMRFLTAFFASTPGTDILLTGSARMQERPIKILVDALQALGAEITYAKDEGYPPLQIRGRELAGGRISLPADVSSQYISALLLVGSRMENGLVLELEGDITSVPYIRMTLSLMDSLGIRSQFEGQEIRVYPFDGKVTQEVVVESDWSSASYFYSLIALAEPGSRLELEAYYQDSRQGDSRLRDIFRDFSVNSSFKDHTLILERTTRELPGSVSYDLSDAPDIAQTIATCCFGLGIGCSLSGLHTLKIKETDRLVALKRELEKLGARVSITENSLELEAGGTMHHGVSVATYNDHRMAMAFAPLGMKVPIVIEDADVVGKSYPDFWTDLEHLGFTINRL